MFFLYSKSCEYAVRALTEAEASSDCFQVEEICRRAKVPVHYARKAIEQLAAEGILEAVRGRGGGYRFVGKPEQISVLQLVKAIDGEEAFNQCVMGLPHCGSHHPCPLHETWQGVKRKYLKDLENKTLGDLMRFSEKKTRRRIQRKVKA